MNKYKEYYKDKMVIKEPLQWNINSNIVISDIGHNFKYIKNLSFSTNKKLFLETEEYILCFIKISSSGLNKTNEKKFNKRIQITKSIYDELFYYSLNVRKKILIIGVYNSFERYTYIAYDNKYFNLNKIKTSNSLWIDYNVFYICVSNKKLIHEKTTRNEYLIYSFTSESSSDFFNNLIIKEIFNNIIIKKTSLNDEIETLCEEGNINEIIGFVGEYIINKKLQKSEFNNQYIWNRENGNIWANHDFFIEKKIDNAIVYEYIEVKTFININEPHFFISKNEYDFVIKNKANYKFYLVWFSSELLSELINSKNKIDFINNEIILKNKYKISESSNMDKLFINNYNFQPTQYLWSQDSLKWGNE